MITKYTSMRIYMLLAVTAAMMCGLRKVIFYGINVNPNHLVMAYSLSMNVNADMKQALFVVMYQNVALVIDPILVIRLIAVVLKKTV